MIVLVKFIIVNIFDLVLFVGEVLVGNEVVDQLVKFNRVLVDYFMVQIFWFIDGIVFIKFDIIDDKVGVVIFMMYIISKFIVFVGIGQIYCDLCSFNVKVVVVVFMKV